MCGHTAEGPVFGQSGPRRRHTVWVRTNADVKLWRWHGRGHCAMMCSVVADWGGVDVCGRPSCVAGGNWSVEGRGGVGTS